VSGLNAAASPLHLLDFSAFSATRRCEGGNPNHPRAGEIRFGRDFLPGLGGITEMRAANIASLHQPTQNFANIGQPVELATFRLAFAGYLVSEQQTMRGVTARGQDGGSITGHAVAQRKC